MKGLIDPLLDMEEYNQILHSIDNYSIPLNVVGLDVPQKAHISYALSQHLNCRALYIVSNEMQARQMFEEFSFFLGDKVLLLPDRQIMMYDIEAKSNEHVFERVKVLSKILEEDFSIIITSAEALSHKLVSKRLFKDSIIELLLGQNLDLKVMARKLVETGYERVDMVENPGQFAIRGGIVDVFPVNMDYAVRIELFDYEIDSMRNFDPISQRSVGNVQKATIIPARDTIYLYQQKNDIIDRIKNALRRTKKTDYFNELSKKVNSDIEKIQNQGYFAGIDRYIPLILKNPVHLLDYISNETIVFMDEPFRIKERIDSMINEHYEVCKGLMEKAVLLADSYNMFFDFEDLNKKLESKVTIMLNTLPQTIHNARYDTDVRINILSKSVPSYQGHLEMFSSDIRNWKERGSRIIILTGTKSRGEWLLQTLKDNDIDAVYNNKIPQKMQSGQLVISHGSLSKGFEYPDIGFVVIGDNDVFGNKVKRKKTGKLKKGAKINVFTDLKPGDYVVHQAHGIGQYIGIEKLDVDNVKRDYLKIQYNGGDNLYIPTNQLDIIQKYIGSEGKTPKLNKLGGTDWVKTKKRVKESLRELAGELIKLYAQRQSVKGFAFSKDTVWQKQFEDLFQYQETPDQLRCIQEVKKDMESHNVMDRLLCGDVGYGKTEVAIRAMFKCVMDGKQAAYLVPTTVLAQQHYQNFKERLKDFPVTVDVISRFRSKSDQKQVLRNTKAGNIDILIGTHRLLQKDIKFKDLGILIIDEEQRFGVTHKEKLKNFYSNVDVLTLTATPIPRTLHMSLAGIRDISVIEDPPEERYPVQTYVMEYNEQVIRDAILRELARNGQVFYLFNRVKSINVKASQIKRLVPEAEVVVAHGQMNEKELENVMMDFINGDYNVLVCTTIIESGLDMPNVNTIIVEDADRMGLSQLYQLRGRVGRSNRLAYAYITYRKDKVITEIAEKRLKAIKEFTEFGSGLKIAMRDLEIRGAGNLLGPEQHGHMESVGYDMYCKLLDEAVKELKGEDYRRTEQEVNIDLNVDAFIDDRYISSEKQKIEMYKKISSIEDEEDVIDIEDELMDRYGDIPQPVKNLISIACIKAAANKTGVSSVAEKKGSLIFQLSKDKKINTAAIGKLMSKYKRKLMFNAGNTPYLMYRLSDKEKNKLLDNIKILLQDMKCFEV